MSQPVWSSQSGNVILRSDGPALTVIFTQDSHQVEILIKQVMYYRRGFDKFTQQVRAFLGCWKSMELSFMHNDMPIAANFKVKLQSVWADLSVSYGGKTCTVTLSWADLLNLANNLDLFFS